MSKKQSTLAFNVRRMISFFKVFLKNKRGIAGLLLAGFFVFLALGANLLTPYNQLGYVEGEVKPLAGSMAAPSWLRVLPPALGGNPDLSENVKVVSEPKFSSENWKWQDGGDWNLTISSGAESAVNVGWSSVGGHIADYSGKYLPNADDSNLLVTFNRTGSEKYGNVSILIFKDFDYPYSGPPANALASVDLSVEGTRHVENRTVWNDNWGGDPSKAYIVVETDVADVAAKVILFAISPNGSRFNLWPSGKSWIFNGDMFNQSGYADARRFPVWESGDAQFQGHFLLPAPSKGRYRFGAEILLTDYYNGSDVSMSFRIYDLNLNLRGTAFGLLGTTYYGYDIWSELVYGARVSLYAGVVSAVLSIVIGLSIGLASGYLGRIFDELMMRASDVLLVLPGLPLLIVLFAILGATIENLIILNGLLGWMGFAKLVRSQVLSIRERPFIEAAKAAGAGTGHIIVKHVMPNVMGLVYVTLATAVPGAIVAEAALSWLGFFDWRRMSWGRMLQEMQAANAVDKWWWVVPPGLCIAAISVAFILLGYALDEVLNPKLRVRR